MTITALVESGFALAQASGSTPPAQNNDQLVIWAIILIGMAVALLLAEIFVPSGGLLGSCSLLSMIGGIVMLFRLDTAWGIAGVIVTLLAIPFAFFASLYVMPRSPIGRALTLSSDKDDAESAYDGQVANPQSQGYKPPVEVGTIGKSLTELRPVGTCLIDGKRCECLSDAGVIEPDTQVRVVHADGLQIKVRPVDGD